VSAPLLSLTLLHPHSRILWRLRMLQSTARLWVGVEKLAGLRAYGMGGD
jgi:hypothetical protein